MPSPETVITIRSSQQLGKVARSGRKRLGYTLRQVSASTSIGVRFLSEFERGKATAEIGKVLEALHAAGLDLAVIPREEGPAGSSEAAHLSRRLNLEFPYDWPNSCMNEAAFIRQVLRKGRFHDLLRIVGHFGLERVESELEAFEGTPEAPHLERQLSHIRLGMDRASPHFSPGGPSSEESG